MRRATAIAVTLTILLNAALVSTSFAETSHNSDLNFAQVTYVEARQSSNGLWCFNTTVRHNDQGWDHYADQWTVFDMQGKELASRVLAHPHDHEQPFTRSQCNISIPDGVTEVVVRAKCSQHGYGGQDVMVNLAVAQGNKFKVSR